MSDDKQTGLKPCPKCGGPAEMLTGGMQGMAGSQSWSVKVRCTQCGLSTEPVADGFWNDDGVVEALVAAGWNKRSSTL